MGMYTHKQELLKCWSSLFCCSLLAWGEGLCDITSSYTSNLCLQTMEKTAFESLSHDFSSFKNFVVSVTNLCQGNLKISQENAKLSKCLFNFPSHDIIASSHIGRTVAMLPPHHYHRPLKSTKIDRNARTTNCNRPFRGWPRNFG